VNKNYGFVFTIWDKLFGTYMTLAEAEQKRARTHPRAEIN
jgi:sterol desaturase/sphingolipid hydroxylase (fatty acid hydroxylase superfamily)